MARLVRAIGLHGPTIARPGPPDPWQGLAMARPRPRPRPTPTRGPPDPPGVVWPGPWPARPRPKLNSGSTHGPPDPWPAWPNSGSTHGPPDPLGSTPGPPGKRSPPMARPTRPRPTRGPPGVAWPIWPDPWPVARGPTHGPTDRLRLRSGHGPPDPWPVARGPTHGPPGVVWIDPPDRGPPDPSGMVRHGPPDHGPPDRGPSGNVWPDRGPTRLAWSARPVARPVWPDRGPRHARLRAWPDPWPDPRQVACDHATTPDPRARWHATMRPHPTPLQWCGRTHGHNPHQLSIQPLIPMDPYRFTHHSRNGRIDLKNEKWRFSAVF